MSFQIVRGFLNSATYDTKIIVGGKLKTGWRCIRECIPEIGFYSGIVSPFVIVCNHYANTKPRLERVESEVLEAHDAINRKVWCLDEGEQYRRLDEALDRRIKENKALKLQIEELKEKRKKREAYSFKD